MLCEFQRKRRCCVYVLSLSGFIIFVGVFLIFCPVLYNNVLVAIQLTLSALLCRVLYY